MDIKTAFEKFLERGFEFYERVLAKFSVRWREHANRRTIITLVLFGAIALYAYLSIIRPPDNFPIAILVTVEENMPLTAVAEMLEEGGVVRSSFALRFVVAATGHEQNVRAGDYLFKEPKDLFSVARAISIGAFGLEPLRIRIPEGATTKDMEKIFSLQLQRFDEENFRVLAFPLEGFLFPDTYFFLPNATEELVVRTMRQNFDTHIVELEEEIAAFGRPLPEVVTMASLLEKEARKYEDRRKIAGVLWNRLDKGMLLQVDAAFLYTLGRTTYDLSTEDLASDTPYNTYRYKGLPPGPIGSPSIDSLRAAIDPAKHSYLYYLADRKGTTYYSKTYEEHLQKKRRYID
ncbi:MAG: Aminodeoxychorismate lyase [Parcubacteria group bacterium GW2011_GWA2_51_10]|nr:MAG: Aminodeoxychorismate lyase [Parcubacteria group bacterium GW2011_GWA2_51_10]